MASLRLNVISLATMILLLGSIIVAGPLDLKIVYPPDGHSLPAVDSTFILGSVKSGSRLTINGEQVPVHSGGGWLAYLPVKPGEFRFKLRAEKGKDVDTATVTLNVPEPPKYTFDILYIDSGSMLPRQDLSVMSGDLVSLGFSGLPFCNAFCVILPYGDTVKMQEQTPQGFHITRNIFSEESSERSQEERVAEVRGVYRGSYVVPRGDFDSLRLIYHLYPPSREQVEWIGSHPDYGGAAIQSHKLLNLPLMKTDTCPALIKVADEKVLDIVQFKDSVVVIRCGPAKGYLTLFQPAGVKAAVTGREGNWMRLRLTESISGWVIDSAVTVLPHGAPVPHSYVKQISTKRGDGATTVRIGTEDRHPFRIEENLATGEITVSLFGADSDTDWIRYDSQDSLIDHIQWLQPEPGIYQVRIVLREKRIWGYDAYYSGSIFHLEIKQPQSLSPRLSEMRVVVDPGHSPDNGSVGPTGLKEKDANLAIAKKLRHELEHHGVEVVMTRDDDSALPLYERPRIAKKARADLFISIHNNALPDGINPFVNNGISTHYYHPHSAGLAKAVQLSLSENLGLPDFGWYCGNLAVIRPTQYPAILVESAFMIIPEQEALLKTDAFQSKIAKAIVSGIEDFLKEQTKE